MYQVLARKYRPRNFNELVGQNHVSRALTSALERGRLHHAYLFTGTRGVGKTTIARILAKCLNCETGVTSTPCEVCPTCTAVNEGRFIDLIEIDAASRTKVEDTRELLDNVPYAPTQGRFKVYLIDEVHMLSTHSFNALLKTLEEPPEHVKFLFATTDPQKLPITVISRCLQFTLRPLQVDEITSHLTDILAKEQIVAEQDAIWQIAESAQGSLRDAMSLTDQAIAYGQGEIHHQDVKDMLGLIDRTIIYDLILAIHQNQQQRVSQLLLQFRQQALDVSLVLDQLISTLHELAIMQYLPDLNLKYSAEINQKIQQLAGLISAQDLQLYYQIACKGRADLQIAVTQEQGFEMCVLRLLAFRPLQANEVLVAAPQNTAQTAASQPVAQMEQTPQAVATQNTAQAEQHVTELDAVATPDLDGFDYEDDDYSDHTTTQTSVAEPSSDDFLDEDEPEALTHQDQQSIQAQQPTPQALHSTAAISPESMSEPAVNEETAIQAEDKQSESIVFDPNADAQLFGLDEDASSVSTTSDVQSHDDFLLESFDAVAPLGDLAASAETSLVSSTLQSNNASPSITQNVSNAETALFDLAATEVEPNVASATAQPQQTIASNADDQLMPQDILRLQPQVLEGEWTLDKWEYWFRHSELSPAVQELAQHGVMTGQINAESVFHIPEQYQQLLTQLQHALESALKEQWSKTLFKVQYENVDDTTPYILQQQRKQRAYQRAENLLHQEPIVKDILQNFDGELHNIQLK
ncbi:MULTISPECIES: DNA polymerase III subunit gamma/tau [Acinetobacter]|jgi:DNA polymerase-3 subunit gamma/tau|uniref:DNA polymerase III subunit gamma/tau n=1 Tax=Acinetobacter towneri TaxID=202956 RepID=A0AAP9KIZ0_9GAMM|nr:MULTISPECIES: DNA polymerase III subunit gamma/tau [Acinetobacter]GIT82693.1 DNA polymerase III subunit gamma/tau [Acinetobacter seohaensis]ENV69840.1 DNA polymerase III, subunit gamma and tau [Acinetobacter towneri DSM 14962 = CIP 107472]MCA4813884.1 DNA polymerase III subunit gamma/tau [Acinetobacter towneri]MCO8057827.1 DNA polymerase III subunit gamma/tau [Acinetobacter towneri]MCO8063473.1 DNA polymerase III subunit gamma/tau [Acinetobacter towneri]